MKKQKQKQKKKNDCDQLNDLSDKKYDELKNSKETI